MSTVLTQIKDMNDGIYTSEINDIHKRVGKCYENLRKKNIKFTKDMITLIQLDFLDHYDYRINEIGNITDLSPVTKRYLEECQSKLTNFDPLNIKQNLQKMDLI